MSARPIVLVVGFGPFLDVQDNPAARLADAIDGMVRPGLRIIGRRMPVSYLRAPRLTRQWAAAVGAAAVVGVGVARRRTVVTVESRGQRDRSGGAADVDGEQPSCLEPGGPASVMVTMPPQPLARALGAVVGDDAGRYVCNAWIYRVVRALGAQVPVAFIHIPPAGLRAEHLADALAQVISTSPPSQPPHTGQEKAS